MNSQLSPGRRDAAERDVGQAVAANLAFEIAGFIFSYISPSPPGHCLPSVRMIGREAGGSCHRSLFNVL